MIQKPIKYLKHLRSLHRLDFAMARAAAAASLREVNPASPNSWEFSGFSQHGEDGIIDYLTRRLREPHGYFIEIGASNGLENNSTWLALARSFSGLMIDGNPEDAAWCEYLLRPMNYGLTFHQMFVTRENVGTIRKLARHSDPDLFSLDIDGNDYYIAEALMKAGFRPRVWVVEYNSAFGPSRSLTIPYRADFKMKLAHGLDLYCGCSLAAWRGLMSKNGYRFVSVDLSGTNAFFIDPQEFEAEFVANLQGLEFRENCSHAREYNLNWEGQFALIKDQELVDISQAAL
jgi:hypothetical protein